MKKILLIACLTVITTVSFSQTKTQTKPQAKPAAKPTNNAVQPAAAKPSGEGTGSEKIEKPANAEGSGSAATANPLDKSKSVAIQLLSSMAKADNKVMDKDMLNGAVAAISSSGNTDDLINNTRMVLESAPAEAYKSGNADAGRQMAGNFNSDLELNSFNSLLLKWESLLNPSCFDASWKVNEVKWKKEISGTK